jgi:hypothetical protein
MGTHLSPIQQQATATLFFNATISNSSQLANIYAAANKSLQNLAKYLVYVGCPCQ